MAHETATLAAYVAGLKFDDIPQEVLERAKVLTLDFLGSAIRARRDAESTPSLFGMLGALSLDNHGESTVFGDNSVSIRSMEQEGHADGARLLFVTHSASEGDVRATLDGLAGLDVVVRVGSVMRIVGDDE